MVLGSDIPARKRFTTPVPARRAPPGCAARSAHPDHLLADYADAPRSVQPQLELARRQSTFDEVVGGLDESTALYEARRCLPCGNCSSCDNCYGVCPDNAVIKLGAAGEPYRFDFGGFPHADPSFLGCGLVGIA